MSDTTARLLILCPDKPGIVASVSNFLFQHGANITSLDQYSTDPENGEFFMRLEFQTAHMDVSRQKVKDLFEQTVASRFDMRWSLSDASIPKKMAVMVSKYDHALLELLWLWKQKKLHADIKMVISNHPDLKQAVESFGLPYHHIPVSKDNKHEAEQKQLELLQGQADVIVMARYMQILSDNFVKHYPNKIINIHHSFLPAFIGAKPYHQAYERGVKIVGVTAHYATQELDEGPIIEQDVTRVSHRLSINDLVDIGRDLERVVLARAVKWHLEDRIIVCANKTVVLG